MKKIVENLLKKLGECEGVEEKNAVIEKVFKKVPVKQQREFEIVVEDELKEIQKILRRYLIRDGKELPFVKKCEDIKLLLREIKLKFK